MVVADSGWPVATGTAGAQDRPTNTQVTRSATFSWS